MLLKIVIIFTKTSICISDVIFSGTFSFSSPGTFGLFKSRDFLVPGPSGSLGPVLLRPGTFPGLPGTSRDLYFYSFAISWSHHYLTFLILSIFSSDFCQNWIIFFNHRNTTTFLVENEELCVKALLSEIY